MGKFKNNLMKLGVLAGLFLLPNLASATLPNGQDLFFMNMNPQITGGPQTYNINFSLLNSDFIPELEGGEDVNLTSASWAVFLAGYAPNTLISASIDGVYMGSVNLDTLSPDTSAWAVDMTKAAYKQLEDFNAVVKIEVLNGNLGQVVDSAVAGTGTVGTVPEPMSLLLLGGGVFGLGLKKSLKKD